MQFTPWDNPMGTDGFEFVEYAAPDPLALGELFETMGFHAIARHRTKNVTLYRQGEVNFIINAEPNSFAQRFATSAWPKRVCDGVPGEGCQAGVRASARTRRLGL